MASISVSLAGDKTYRDALGLAAKKNNLDMGMLVRKALDESSFSKDIGEALSFFAPSVECIQQSVIENTEELAANHA